MKRIHLSNSEYLSKYVTYLPHMAADYPLKPCGLWYANEDDWQDWCDEHQVPSEITNYKFRYELDIDLSKVCILEDVKTLMNFHKEYGFKCEGNFTAIEWRKVMNDYSGIEVRNYDSLNFHGSFVAIIWLRNWAMDCGCLWDLNHVSFRNSITH